MARTSTWLMPIVVATVLLGSQVAEGNLLVNGSFEDPVVGACVNRTPGSTSITGWVVTRDSIDHCRVWEAADGEQSLDLDGSDGDRGGIKQEFSTVPGRTYTVTFFMAGNIGLPTVKTMRVEAAGQSADFTFDTTGHSYPDMGWEKHRWEFTATGTLTTIEFYSLDSTQGCGSCAAGPTLDKVTVLGVSPIPTVSEWGLVIMGVLVLAAGLMVLRARRRIPIRA